MSSEACMVAHRAICPVRSMVLLLALPASSLHAGTATPGQAAEPSLLDVVQRYADTMLSALDRVAEDRAVRAHPSGPDRRSSLRAGTPRFSPSFSSNGSTIRSVSATWLRKSRLY